MKHGKAAIEQIIDGNGPVADGRRERSRASRSRIIQATMDLIREGNLNPSAALVAQKADVSLRSVFHHFKDKESLRREIDQILIKAYAPILQAPYRSHEPLAQLDELIDRRCQIFEDAAPFRIATWSERHASPFISSTYQKLYEREKAMLDALLPAGYQTQTLAGQAILILTSFDTWRMLRQDEGLSPRKTIETIKALVRETLKSAQNPL